MRLSREGIGARGLRGLFPKDQGQEDPVTQRVVRECTECGGPLTTTLTHEMGRRIIDPAHHALCCPTPCYQCSGHLRPVDESATTMRCMACEATTKLTEG